MKMKTYMTTYTFEVTYVKPGTFNKLEHGTIEISLKLCHHMMTL